MLDTIQPTHFSTFSMKELRSELDSVGADYSSCIEKSEFIEILVSNLNSLNNTNKGDAKAQQPMLSIREIKERLSLLGVDYSHCIEMTELVELLVAKEQGHSTNPFRDSKGLSNAKENEDTVLIKTDSTESLNRSRGLRDITKEGGNSQKQGLSSSKGLKNSTGPTKPSRQQPAPAPVVLTKPMGEPKDLEAADRNDPQACTEYVHDVYSYFRKAEEKYMPTKGYMESASKMETTDGKKVVNTKMRAIVVDWMIELHQRFRPSLQPAALYLGINIFDRFLASGAMNESYRLQVVGAACLLVAAKIEEIYPPKVRELKKMVDGATAQEICIAERAILIALKFNVSNPTVFHFMKRHLKAAEADLKLKALTMYVVEVALHDIKMTEVKPSLLASAAIHLGMHMLHHEETWTATLLNETKYEATELKQCANQLASLLSRVSSDDTLYAVSTKFRSSKYLEVGKVPVVRV